MTQFLTKILTYIIILIKVEVREKM